MRRTHVGLAGLAALSLLVAGCSSQPLGTPYRTIFYTVAGNYRAAELFDLPPAQYTRADGSEFRFSLGTYSTFTGRIILPGATDVRFTGRWTVEDGRVILTFDPGAPGVPAQVVLLIEYLPDRVGLRGPMDVDGQTLALDLAKPLPPEEEEGSPSNSPVL